MSQFEIIEYLREQENCVSIFSMICVETWATNRSNSQTYKIYIINHFATVTMKNPLIEF